MAVLASYTGTTDNIAAVGPATTTNYREAQSFLLSGTSTVTTFSLKFLVNVGSPAGTVTVRIETDNAGLPSGTLADSNLTVDFVPTASSVNSVNFASSGTIAAGTYWLVAQSTIVQTNGNAWILGIKSLNPYPDGINAYYDTMWNAFPTFDEYFTVEGSVGGTATTSTLSMMGVG